MPQSILFDARLVIQKPTGIGRYVTSLFPELLRQGEGEFDFHLLRGSQPWPGFGMAGWNAPNLTHHVSDEKVMSLSQHFWLPRMARKLGADLIHYPHFDAPVLVGKTPVVATIHDARDLARPDFFIGMSKLKRWYMHWFIARSLKRATVITVSHAMAKDLGDRFGVDPKTIPVTWEAADPAFQPATPEQAEAFKQKYGLQRPFILCVGERRPHKNQSALIRAFARSASRKTHDLVIVGKVYADFRGPEETVAELGLGDCVQVLDPIDADDLVASYTAADLFVLVSLYEGFGLPILEAMACGTPVVGSNTTATGEVVGEGGLRVDPEDVPAIAAAIDTVLGDEQVRQQWIEKGRRWAASFTWARTAAETLAVYRQILGTAS